MKIAYVSFDQNANKTTNILSRYASVIDYYLINPHSASSDFSFESCSVLVNGLCIPAETALQTPQHKQLFRMMDRLYQEWCYHIYHHFKQPRLQNVHSFEYEKKSDVKIRTFSTQQISFIKINRLSAKYVIELTEHSEQNEYDYVFIENSQFVMREILDKQQNLFHAFTEQSKCLMTLDYKVRYRSEDFKADRKFLLVDQMQIENTQDNWYLVETGAEQISVSFYVPLSMSQNSEYRDFLIQRTAQVISKHLSTFKIDHFIQHQVSLSNGHFTHKARLRYRKGATLVPCFKFWSSTAVEAYLQKLLQMRAEQLKKALLKKQKYQAKEARQ